MAKSQHTFMKRQREIDKRKKAAAKREKREEKKNQEPGSGPEIATHVVNHGLVIGNATDSGLSPQSPNQPHVKSLRPTPRIEEPRREPRPERRPVGETPLRPVGERRPTTEKPDGAAPKKES